MHDSHWHLEVYCIITLHTLAGVIVPVATRSDDVPSHGELDLEGSLDLHQVSLDRHRTVQRKQEVQSHGLGVPVVDELVGRIEDVRLRLGPLPFRGGRALEHRVLGPHQADADPVAGHDAQRRIDVFVAHVYRKLDAHCQARSRHDRAAEPCLCKVRRVRQREDKRNQT